MIGAGTPRNETAAAEVLDLAGKRAAESSPVAMGLNNLELVSRLKREEQTGDSAASKPFCI